MLPNLIPLYLYQGHPLPPPRHLYDYVLAEQGLIKRIEASFVTADHLLVPIAADLIGLHLAPYPRQGLQLKVPRLPGQLLAQVYHDARRDLSREVMYHCKFNHSRGWWVERAEATHQSAVRVSYRYDPRDIVLDLHSHQTMGAFFSQTDDDDEQGCRFYGVIGRLDQPRPELALRLGLFGHWIFNIPGLTLFDDLGPFVDKQIESGDRLDMEPALEQINEHWLTRWLKWR
jgi:PRTRC genetic system protein A